MQLRVSVNLLCACSTHQYYPSLMAHPFPTSCQNDNHNRIESANSNMGYCSAEDEAADECFGGWARIATAVQGAKAKDPQMLVLSAGDEFMGT